MTHGAAMIIFDDLNRVLLLRRGKTAPYMPGAWNLPGGHAEPNESLEMTAKRELKEEAGLRAQKATFFKTIRFAPEGWEVSYFLAHPGDYSGTVKLNYENDAFAWVQPSELAHLKLLPTVKEAIESLTTKATSTMPKHRSTQNMVFQLQPLLTSSLYRRVAKLNSSVSSLIMPDGEFSTFRTPFLIANVLDVNLTGLTKTQLDFYIMCLDRQISTFETRQINLKNGKESDWSIKELGHFVCKVLVDGLIQTIEMGNTKVYNERCELVKRFIYNQYTMYPEQLADLIMEDIIKQLAKPAVKIKLDAKMPLATQELANLCKKHRHDLLRGLFGAKDTSCTKDGGAVFGLLLPSGGNAYSFMTLTAVIFERAYNERQHCKNLLSVLVTIEDHYEQ